MKYITRTEYKNGTIEFYYIFSGDDGFIDYLMNKKNLKDNVGALSFAVARAKKTVRVIMPLGTNEREFNDKMHQFFTFENNMLVKKITILLFVGLLFLLQDLILWLGIGLILEVFVYIFNYCVQVTVRNN